MFDNTETGLTTDEGFRVEDFHDNAEEFNKGYENAGTTSENQQQGDAVYTMNSRDKLRTKWALRDRQKSKVLWAAIVGCIMTVFSVFGMWEKIGITAEGFKEIAGAVGAVLAAFGVFNDPTNKEGF